MRLVFILSLLLPIVAIAFSPWTTTDLQYESQSRRPLTGYQSVGGSQQGSYRSLGQQFNIGGLELDVQPRTATTNPAAICSAIKAANGLVRGKLVKSKTGKDVCAFLGIPFAKRPIGELRFKRPVPVGNWEGTLDATTLPNACWQPVDESSKGSDFYPNTKLSEDCLYLNIWAPVSTVQNAKDEQNATVMIWIHGGALTTGSSSLDLYNGEIFAGNQEVILASMNYRLGPFGFLYLNTKEAPGNMGLLDQNLAIKWIKANIANFGGNPDEITIFGESAGSMSVAHHLLSPLSRGLFKRAILESGVATGPIMYWDPKDSLIAWHDFAEKMGCLSTRNELICSKNKFFKCLQSLEPSKVANFAPTSRKFLDFSGAATVDGYFLPDTPKDLLKNYEIGARADIIIGVVKDEGSLFLLLDEPISGYFPLTTSPPTISYDTFVTVLQLVFRQKSIQEQNAIISRYTNWVNVDDSAQNLQRIIEAIGDYAITCPSVDWATHWAARGHRVYAYDFTQRSSNSPYPKWFGVMHLDEIEYVFGRVGAQVARPESERELSLEMNRLWAEFAKTGVPSEKWETFTRAHPVYLNFNATTITAQTTSNIFGPRAEACAFWNNDLPLLHTYLEEAHSCGRIW